MLPAIPSRKLPIWQTYQAVTVYFGKPWGERWMASANRGKMFAGRTPVDYMLRHGQPGTVQVRRMLDAWRGGF